MNCWVVISFLIFVDGLFVRVIFIFGLLVRKLERILGRNLLLVFGMLIMCNWLCFWLVRLCSVFLEIFSCFRMVLVFFRKNFVFGVGIRWFCFLINSFNFNFVFNLEIVELIVGCVCLSVWVVLEIDLLCIIF